MQVVSIRVAWANQNPQMNFKRKQLEIAQKEIALLVTYIV